MSYKKKPGTINPDEIDPSVYYYDEVYDEMKEEEKPKRDDKSSINNNKTSKYTQGLLETAEIRKNEKELRKLKRYARDRVEAEEEGNLSKEDIYITPAYKEKLRQMEELEKERRSRLDKEQSSSMNFLKNTTSSKRDRSKDRESKSKHGSKVSESKSRSREHKSRHRSSDGSSEYRHRSRDRELNIEKPSTSRSKDVMQDIDCDQTKISKPIMRPKPKTMRERREYLREILAKRTVGKVYDEALERYIKRKARVQ